MCFALNVHDHGLKRIRYVGFVMLPSMSNLIFVQYPVIHQEDHCGVFHQICVCWYSSMERVIGKHNSSFDIILIKILPHVVFLWIDDKSSKWNGIQSTCILAIPKTNSKLPWAAYGMFVMSEPRIITTIKCRNHLWLTALQLHISSPYLSPI